eukprot:TRINITY_DN482_c1_g1_i1.p1 TRINITY_DN482_c1_g1~~TRINITY_DN482_c1_g1_i1.p1  ORF type:complete len:64 (+),score=5.15 TRINITY_DN482_c1_g1_i1:176-367(+)
MLHNHYPVGVSARNNNERTIRNDRIAQEAKRATSYVVLVLSVVVNNFIRCIVGDLLLMSPYPV